MVCHACKSSTFVTVRIVHPVDLILQNRWQQLYWEWMRAILGSTPHRVKSLFNDTRKSATRMCTSVSGDWHWSEFLKKISTMAWTIILFSYRTDQWLRALNRYPSSTMTTNNTSNQTRKRTHELLFTKKKPCKCSLPDPMDCLCLQSSTIELKSYRHQRRFQRISPWAKMPNTTWMLPPLLSCLQKKVIHWLKSKKYIAKVSLQTLNRPSTHKLAHASNIWGVNLYFVRRMCAASNIKIVTNWSDNSSNSKHMLLSIIIRRL